MTIAIHYCQDDRTAAPRLRTAREVWAVATRLRRQLPAAGTGMQDGRALMAAVRHVVVNGRAIEIVWDGDHDVHDEDGKPVFGVCETDPDNPAVAYVSVNGPLLRDRPDILASTIAHELGHVVFDVPGVQRRYRSVTAATSLHAGERASEWRANEFMGALLVPAFELHRELLRLAAGEGLRLARAEHHGRPGAARLSTGAAMPMRWPAWWRPLPDGSASPTASSICACAATASSPMEWRYADELRIPRQGASPGARDRP